VLLGSCATTDSGTVSSGSGPQGADEATKARYSGSAEAAGNTFLNARNQAIMAAVRLAVIDMIGADQEAAARTTLEEVLYNSRNPNAYIVPDSEQSVRRETRGEDNWYYELSVEVNLVAVRNTLEANGLTGAGAPQQGGAAGVVQREGGPVSQPGQTATAPAALELTDDEEAFIARYVDRMTYMVYFNEEAGEEEFYEKSAVGKANEYLASQALDTIDAEQIERLKEDQQAVYEQETGESISIIQWIAQRLNADIYIEIYGQSRGTSQGDKHYGEASIELKAFEASSAVLMGSASYNTLEKAFSQTSQEAARVNAIQGAVFKTMPRLIEQVKNNMQKALERGLRYEVVIQKPLGDRTMSRFWSRLQRDVEEIKSVSQSPEEVKYYVWYIGSVDDLKNVIYDASEQVAGLENMEMVLTRGKSITFNTYQ
jgi:hypothetical protein